MNGFVGIVLAFVILGLIVWGVGRLDKAMEPDPEWDGKTRDRWGKMCGLVAILLIVIFLLAGRGC